MKPKNTFNSLSRNTGFRFAQRISLSFCIFFLLLAFTTGDSKSEYIVPALAYSVYSADIDIDGDNDILVGHNYSFSTQWSGISILLNYGEGYFELYDSVFLFGGQPDVQLANLNSNPLLEIIAKYEDYENEMEYISIINDFNLDDINYLPLNTYVGVNQINKGDINGDGHTDIVVASTNGHFWGVLYNDGAGNYNAPDYYYSQNWYIELAVSDIDSNGRDDIALCGPDTEIYFSFDTGFEYYFLSESEHDIEIADIDNDGDMDIITIWGPAFATFICYENLGYQNFNQHTIFSFEGAAGGLRVPDLNNDSLPEITFGYGTKYYILYNKGGFEFLEPDTILPNFPGSIDRTWADVDNNQFQDIIMVCSGNGSVPNLKILFNDGNGNFGENPITKMSVHNIG